MATAAALIAHYGLEPHPEGGCYQRWYTSTTSVGRASGGGAGLDERWDAGATRPVATSIHYLCPTDGKSSLHELKSDELWFWHVGEPLEVIELHPPATEGGDAVVRRTVLGPDLAAGQTLTHVVRAGACFGARCNSRAAVPAAATPAAGASAGGGSAGFAFVSCVVAPGFDFADFSMRPAAELLQQYPGAEAAAVIAALSADAAAS